MDNKLPPEAQEVQDILGINMTLFFADLREINSNRELTDQQKRYISLSFMGLDGLDIARLDYQEHLRCRFPSHPDQVEEELRNKSRDIRSYIGHNIVGLTRNFISKKLKDNQLSSRRGIAWQMIIIRLLKNGYRIER